MAKIKEVLKGIKCRSVSSCFDMYVRGISDDSRKIRDGDLFVAARGLSTDGYNFIGSAVQKGARVIVSDRDFKAPSYIKKIIVKDARSAISVMADNFYGHPSKNLKMIGVTGTNGKTTVVYLIENILNGTKKKTGVIGTINYRVGGRHIPAKNTTPGCLELQSLLSEMLEKKAGYVVMEVSSHSLDQDRVACLSYDVGIFTNIAKDHLDYHKTKANYFKAKAKLFKKLKKNGVAVINNDDKMAVLLKRRINKRILTYGIRKRSDVMAKDVRLSMGSSSFLVNTPSGSFSVVTRLIGMHNISNILASIAAALALGIRLDVIKKGIESFRSVPGRLEPVDHGQPFKVFVDFAHTEDALYNVLSLLRDVTQEGRIITIFGCGGNRDRSKRPLMGKVACKLSDKVVITSDNPRSEDPGLIISEIEKGIKGRFTNYEITPDRKKAIGKVLRSAGSGDIVLIAGKGHEKYQVVNDKTIPFDDCEVASSILRGMS